MNRFIFTIGFATSLKPFIVVIFLVAALKSASCHANVDCKSVPENRLAQVAEVRKRLGIEQVLLTSNWVPSIRVQYDSWKTPEEVLGPKILQALPTAQNDKAVVFNPNQVALNDRLLKEISVMLDSGRLDPKEEQFPIGPKMYRLYQKLFSVHNRSATQISVLGQPVNRSDGRAPVTPLDLAKIHYPENWLKAGSRGANRIFYATDGVSHYTFEMDNDITAEYNPSRYGSSEKNAVQVEIMVAPSLPELQRMLMARYGEFRYSSQGTFHLPNELVSLSVTESDWALLRTDLANEKLLKD